MARGDQLGRQWRIIQTLITSGTGKSAADLANELECNPRTLYLVEQTIHLGIKPYKDYGRFKEILKLAQDAAVSRKTVEMVYHTMSRKKETRRRVDPYRLWFFNGTFYLIGHCHVREEVKFWVMGWGSHARVLEPESLAKAIRSEAEAVAALYGLPASREEGRSAS